LRPDRDRLADILEAIEKIRKRLPLTEEELAASELLQVWVIHHLQVIGEAANNLSPGFIADHRRYPGGASSVSATPSFTSTSVSTSTRSGASRLTTCPRSRRQSPRSSSGPGDVETGPSRPSARRGPPSLATAGAPQ
jgi:hypothetical protein